MTGNYTIALAEPEHLREIPKLEQAASATIGRKDLPRHLRYLVTDRETIELAQKEQRLWVALGTTRHPVGFALAEVADDQAYLSELDVHPAHGRRGLGRRLVAAVVDWAVAEGFDSVLLVTFRHLPWNAPFYEKLGFVQLAERELGRDLRGIFEEEAAAGVNMENRVGMRLNVRQQARDTAP